MHRSSSNTRVAVDYYKNSSSYNSSSSPVTTTGDGKLPVYSPSSQVAKKERLFNVRSAENAVHLIPLVLLVCAVILWVFSNPVDVVKKMPDLIVARHQGLKAAGGIDIDGTQNSFLPHTQQLDDRLVSDLQHRHLIEQSTPRKRSM